jgi:exonuclease SbcC
MSLGSGMEQFILSTAIRVALINLSNLPRSNFLILDEPFGVLDAENLASMGAFFSYLKPSFDFIIIVSHIDVIKDIVDSNIEIKKENGFSKIIHI